MAESEICTLINDKEVHTGSGILLCPINNYNLKISYVYNILNNTVIFNYVHEYERDVCRVFEAELKDYIRHHWLSKLNTKKR